MNKVSEGFLRISNWLSRRKKTEEKVPEEMVTVDDLLSRDDVNCILGETLKVKKDIKHLIVVWEDDQGVLGWKASNMRMSKAVGLLEMTKMFIMKDNEYECSEDD